MLGQQAVGRIVGVVPDAARNSFACEISKFIERIRFREAVGCGDSSQKQACIVLIEHLRLVSENRLCIFAEEAEVVLKRESPCGYGGDIAILCICEFDVLTVDLDCRNIVFRLVVFKGDAPSVGPVQTGKRIARRIGDAYVSGRDKSSRVIVCVFVNPPVGKALPAQAAVFVKGIVYGCAAARRPRFQITRGIVSEGFACTVCKLDGRHLVELVPCIADAVSICVPDDCRAIETVVNVGVSSQAVWQFKACKVSCPVVLDCACTVSNRHRNRCVQFIAAHHDEVACGVGIGNRILIVVVVK